MTTDLKSNQEISLSPKITISTVETNNSTSQLGKNLKLRRPSKQDLFHHIVKTPTSADRFNFSPFSISSNETSNSLQDPRKTKFIYPENQASTFVSAQRAVSGSVQSNSRHSIRRNSRTIQSGTQRLSESSFSEGTKKPREVGNKTLRRRNSSNPEKKLSRNTFSAGVLPTGDPTLSQIRGSVLSEATQDGVYPNRRRRSKSHFQSGSGRALQNRLRTTQHLDTHVETRVKRTTKHGRFRLPYALFSPLDRFRRMVRLVRLLIRCLVDYQRVTVVSQSSQMSFAMLSNDMVSARTYRHGLTFDSSDFRIAKETLLNEKLRQILTILPYHRTKSQVDYALKCLRSEVEEFAEFPLSMQQSLVRVAWLDEFEPKRVIIRQGHKAETFYFILYGTALVTRNRINANGEGYVETVNILKRGKSFGELAIMRREQRTNNVVSQTRIALLTVGRKDFIEIFMHRMDGEEPEFITFLKKVPEFQGFPLYKVPRNKPTICAFTYFRVGVVICANSSESDVIVIVKSGVCRVLKQLRATKPNIHGLKEAPKNHIYEKAKNSFTSNVLSQQTFGQQRPVMLTSPESPVSLLVGPKHPSLQRRFTLNLIQAGRPSLTGEPSLQAEFNINKSLSNFHKNDRKNMSCKDHKRKIWNSYKKWQENHPISRETFALLMTGRDLNEDEDDNSDDSNEDSNDSESEDKFDIRERINTYFLKRHSSREEPDELSSRRSSIQSNFRTQILKRSRTSLADAWMQQNKKISTVSSTLPTLSEDNSSQQKNKRLNRNLSETNENKSVFIHVETLREGAVFGLLPIVFNASEGATPMSLISDGAECILISKDFFMRHFDNELREKLVRMVQPYPSEETMQANMQNQTNWDAYKFMTVHSLVVNRIRSKKKYF